MKQSKTLASGFPVMLDEERAKYVAREVKYEETIVDLRKQLAEKDAENRLIMLNLTQCGEQLAATQAREVQLREVIGKAKEGIVQWHVPENRYAALDAINEALALPQDTTALEAMIAKAGEVMRELAATACTDRSTGTDTDDFNEWDHCNYSCAEEIRALPGVTLEDLK